MNSAYSLDYELFDNINVLDIVEDQNILHNPFGYLYNELTNTNLINFKHTLSTNESMVFELRYNGFKYKEIANLLDVSLSCVDNCIHRIKTKLKKYLNK